MEKKDFEKRMNELLLLSSMSIRKTVQETKIDFWFILYYIIVNVHCLKDSVPYRKHLKCKEERGCLLVSLKSNGKTKQNKTKQKQHTLPPNSNKDIPLIEHENKLNNQIYYIFKNYLLSHFF